MNSKKCATMVRLKLLDLLILLNLSGQIFAQDCGQYSTCGQCMSDYSCSWCADPDYAAYIIKFQTLYLFFYCALYLKQNTAGFSPEDTETTTTALCFCAS